MSERKKSSKGRNTEGVMKTVAKTLGGALGRIAGAAETFAKDHETPAKNSPAKRSSKAATPKNKQGKKAARKRTPARRAKG